MQSLEYESFCKEDFVVLFPDDSSNLVEIKFRALPSYSFTIGETYNNSGPFGALHAMSGNAKLKLVTHESPGEYKSRQTTEHDSISECIGSIHAWTRRIQEELRTPKAIAIANDSELDEIIESFHQKIDHSIEDQEAFFSATEQTEILERLNALQNRLEELEAKFSLSEQDTAKVKTAIEKTKQDLPNFPRGVWYKTAGNKIINALKVAMKTKEVRELALEATKKFLL